jgi:hypothetical protein
MLSKRTLKRIEKASEKQANQMIRAVKKINKLKGEAEFRNNPNTVVLIVCPICKQRQSDFRIKVPTGGCENRCEF